jgi:hypothetical protein
VIHLAPQTIGTVLAAAVLGGLCARGASPSPLAARVADHEPSPVAIDGGTHPAEPAVTSSVVEVDAAPSVPRTVDTEAKPVPSGTTRPAHPPATPTAANDAGAKAWADAGGGR